MFVKSGLMLLFLLSISLGGEMYPAYQNLMPVPDSVAVGKGKFRLTENFYIAVQGARTPRALKGATRMLDRLRGRTGLFIAQPIVTEDANPDSAQMVLKINRAGKLNLGEREDYLLEISDNAILLQAETDIGALRGLETFLQLLDADDQGYFFQQVTIKDSPRFPWRGLLIDACRHFMPVEVIKRNLDGMAAVKLNVLHWHLSEDQGFRVECKTFPLLHEKASDGKYYTQAQIKEIIDYASDRGIRVVPEFDLPGHATSWLTAYPQYASAPGPYHLQREWGVFDPTFNPTKEETYQFLDRFFAEMSALFPDDYMHIGGDENNGKQWSANPQIQQFMKEHNIKDNHALQAYFNNRLLKILTKYHKKLVGWDEILHPDMPTNIVIQSWRGRDAMIKAAQQGYQTILSNGYYIDLIQPTDFHYLNDPAPADLPLTPEQKKKIIGGEATMWSELVSPETIDSRIWPRTAAITERLWSPESVRDVPDMYRRLDILSFRLEELGLTHLKNYPMMLRRLTNNADIEQLKILVDVIEPVKRYKRHRLRKHYTYTPLTRVVDAARPDAEVARHFRNLMDEYLNTGQNERKIVRWLVIWKENDAKLQPIIEKSPILWEIKTLSRNLSRLASIGIQAVNYYRAKKVPPKKWQTKAEEVLTRAAEPQAQTELMILPAIQKLVNHLKDF